MMFAVPPSHIFKLLLNILITFYGEISIMSAMIILYFDHITCIFFQYHVIMCTHDFMLRCGCLGTSVSIHFLLCHCSQVQSDHHIVQQKSCPVTLKYHVITECCTDNILLKYFLHWNL